MRAGWSIADQAVSSLTNATLSFIVARSASVSAFGAFALAFTVYALVVALERTFVGQPLNIRTTSLPDEEFRHEVRGALGGGLLLGLVSGLILIGIGYGLGGQSRSPFIAMGIVLPALLLQDACRMGLFAQRRPSAALVNDLTWGFVQVLAMGWLLVRGADDAASFTLAWGFAALAAAIVGLFQLNAVVSLRASSAWFTAHYDLTRYLMPSALAVLGAQQIAFTFVGIYGALAEVGSLRGANALIAPWAILSNGLIAVALPELARRQELSTRFRVRFAVLVTGALVVFGFLLLVFLYLVPAAGSALLGDTWDGARSVLFLIFLGNLGNVAALAPACILDSLGDARTPFRGAMVTAPLMVVLSVVGVIVAGANGAAAGLAIAAWACVPYLWLRSVKGKKVVGLSIDTEAVLGQLPLQPMEPT